MHRRCAAMAYLLILASAPIRADDLPVLDGPAFDAAAGRPGETAPGPGGRLAWVINGTEGQELRLERRCLAVAEEIGDLQWTRSGELAYWIRDHGRERVVLDGRVGEAWDEIRTPDLEALAHATDPRSWSWTDRGGAKVSFAARDPKDPARWVRLTRRPSQPPDQERRALRTTRIVRAESDPGAHGTVVRRFHLIAGRVPAYVGRRGREECLVVGTREMACGHRIEMIAMAPRTGRLLVGWRERADADLLLSDGLVTTGPWRRIDWVSFSQDGLHYALLVSDREGDRIQTDGRLTGRLGRLTALSHLADGALAALWFLKDRGILLADDRVIAEAPVLVRFLRPRAGDPIPILLDGEGVRVGADPAGPRFRQVWAEGFLPDGRVIAQVTPQEGGQGLLVGDRLEGRGDALTRFVTSDDGSRIMIAVRNRSTGGEAVTLDGELLWNVDEVTNLGFVGEGLAALPWVRHGRAGKACLRTTLVDEALCCEELLGWTGAPAAPLALCRDGEGPSLVASDGTITRAEAMPPEFMTVGPDGRVVWFVTRDVSGWNLHGADGRTEVLPGRALMMLSGSGPGDRPRILVQTSGGQGWYLGPSQGCFDAALAELPHELDDLGPVYRARTAGRQRWVTPRGSTPAVDALGSAPYPVPGGFSWWERRGGRWYWATCPYDGGND